MGNLHYQISTEKFIPEPGVESRTLGFLSRGSTTGAILVLIEDKRIIWALGNLHYQISTEKFIPEPGVEPRTLGFLARRSTTGAILVLIEGKRIIWALGNLHYQTSTTFIRIIVCTYFQYRVVLNVSEIMNS